MSRISKAKHQLYLQEWAAKISECQNSGLHITEWCSQHNIDTHAYYYWLKQLREETLDHIPELANINFPAVKAEAVPSNITSADNITFKKLEVKTPLPNTQAAVIVHLPSATIEVTNGATKETVEAVLLALRSAC